MAEAESYTGRVLAGRYRLTEKVNEGGMGAIWRAEHLVLRASVAVKLIDREMLEHPNAVDRFMQEAQAAASLRSPHVVQILDYGVDIDVPFIVMEFLEGETLAERLRRKTCLAPEEAAHLLAHVARAMVRAHEAGIVHRDLKPDNIFIVQNADEELAKVLDFGVAKVNTADISGQGAKTRTGSLLGTPYYMSPEQVQGNKDVDYRSDLWALGVIAFECMTGERPFASNGLGDLVLQICVRPMPVPSAFARVPIQFDAWFQKACEREPASRFQSAREMSDELRRALGVELKGFSDSQPEILVGPEPRTVVSHGPRAKSDAPTMIAEAIEPSLSATQLEDLRFTVVEGARSGIVEPPLRSLKLPMLPRLEAPEPRAGHALIWVVVLTLAVGSAFGLLLYLRYPGLLSRFGLGERSSSQPPLADPVKNLRSDRLLVGPSKQEPVAEPSVSPAESAPLVNSAPAPSELAPALSAASSPPSASVLPALPGLPGALGAPGEPAAAVPSADAGIPPAGSATADAGWVKPSWAVPDDSPPKKDPPEPGAPPNH